MAKRTRGTRKSRKGTRKMKRGGGIFNRLRSMKNTLKNKVKSGSNTLRNKYSNLKMKLKNKMTNKNAPHREGSSAALAAAHMYVANKHHIDALVKRLDDAVEGAMRKEIPDWSKSMSPREIVKRVPAKRLAELMREKVTISKEGTKEAREALEELFKLSSKEKKSKIMSYLKRAASALPGAKKVMQFMGIQSESVGSLFDDIDNDTLTAAKAATLVQMIVKRQDLLSEASKKNIARAQNNMKKNNHGPVESNNNNNKKNNNQMGGGDDSGAASFTLWSIAIFAAVPSGGLSLLVALVIQIIMANSD